MVCDQVFSATHRGAVRPDNQDALICRPDLGVFVVADGAGGLENGRAAADAVIASIGCLASAAPASARPEEIQRAIRSVHRALTASGRSATTVVVLVLDWQSFVCLWAGDSRIYLWRQGALMQLTHDHSLVQEMIDCGSLSPADARGHPSANVVTRAVGGIPGELAMARYDGQTMGGDRFLLCSDGLTRAMEDDEIGRLMGGDGDIAATLLDVALRRGARDNVSVIVVRRD